MRATSAWDSAELVCTAELVDFDISNSVGERFKLRARKLKELNLPTQTICNVNCVETGTLPYLCSSNLNLFKIKATLLIGQDNYELIAPISCKKYMPDGPFISQTLLGWCVHGTLGKIDKHRKCSTIENNSSVNTVAHGWESPSQYAPAHCTPSSPFVQLHIQCTADLPIPTGTSTREPPQPQLAGNDIHAYIETYNCACCSDSELHDLVRRSFLIDNLGVYNRPRQNVDEVRAVEIVDKSAKLCHNQWTVSLPWKDESLTMPDNYSYALKRLQSVERKMLLDSEYETRYRERVKHLFDNHYARKLGQSEINDKNIKRRWYLPHFGVDNPNKNKLRLVFDSSAKFNNVSLTTSLLRGPDLLNSLYGIMLRFRENSIGVLGDLKDMFLNIKIDERDQHTLRFLWKEKGSDVVEQYAMTSLIFGANCSPFIAQYINQNKNASRFKSQMPDSVFRIQTNTYMDDYIDSFSDKNIAAKSLGEISYIHKQGHFEMRNWLSNVPEVLSNVPKETISDSVIRFDIDKQPERALGLLWHPGSDMLSFDLSFKRVPDDILSLKRIPTKREVLRIVMSIFDIHGYLVPFTIKGKILMREIWKTNLKWDSELTNDLYNLFKRWISQANEINSIKIPRWYFSCHDNGENDILELHLFCDASPSAYAAVAYWRRVNSDGQVTVSFVASKSRVSSIKSSSVSVPRLELQAAVLACRLASSIEKEHRIRPTSVHYWTDSTTVLCWISNHSRSYKVFIANRLGEIDEYSTSSQWRYVPTDLNIADIGTKNTDYVLCSDSIWFTGPCFLQQHPSYWPQRHDIIKNVDDKILEKVNIVNENLPDYSCVTSLPVPEPSRFSSWLKLLRATATVLLFIKKCRKRPTSGIDGELMHEAEILLLRHSQVQAFRAEINALSSKQELKHDSRLRTLTPIIDKDNLLRVGSRLGNTKDVNEMTKYPVILDGKNHIARLIVMHYHIRAAHSCNEMVVNELRQKYWLVRLRPTVRSVAKQCLVCRFRKALPSPPRLADLPECRLTHHQRAFTMCGVDLFGPMEVTIGRHRSRRYGVLFTCLTVRAVHIELVSSLTTDSMIMALRRMAARRGWPHTVFSDNGTNLRGADIELRRAYQEVLSAESTLATEALNKGVQWRFLSPLSPHKGGAWERLIRSVKTALKVVLKERAPREETLSTLLCEVENMINSRPITHVSVDPRDPEALTPNHLLLGSSSNLPRPGVFDDSDLYLRKQWRIAQRFADLFWSRWMKEVLPTLAPRPKWEREGLQFGVGDLVVVVDPASPRNVWPKGIVEKVYPGADGRPERLMSPYTVIIRRSGNPFELAHVLVSWLIGAGYDAYVVVGCATRDVCMAIRYRTACPEVPDEEEKVQEEAPPEEEPRYRLVPLPDLTSKYCEEMDRKDAEQRQAELDKIENERLRKIAELEKPPPDDIDGWRTHAWVLVLPGFGGVEEPFFIEPSEGNQHPLSAKQYQYLDCIYNNENYYVNLQDCSEGLENISYDLTDLERWEHLLAGEPFYRRQMVGVDQADKRTAVDTEKHLDMPASWVEKLDLTADEFEQRYPGSHRLIHYKKVLLEKFSPYSQRDGIVKRISTFDDYALTKPLVTYEWYKNRVDKMENARIDHVKKEVREVFGIGRRDHLLKHMYSMEAPVSSVEGDRTLEFNYYARLDHLTKLVCTPLTFDEYYTHRDDRLESRMITYSEGNKSEPKRQVLDIVETYSRNHNIPAKNDIWKKIFHMQENTIQLLYHYAYNFVTNDTRHFIKPNLAETGGKILFYPDKTSGYIADPIAPQPRPLDVYYALCHNMECEYKTNKHIRDRETDINGYLKQRHRELTEPMLYVSLYDTERNEAAKKGWKEQELQKAEVSEREIEAEIDPLAPYLARMFGSGHGAGVPLTVKEATLVREQCINDFRAKQLARQNLVHERFDALNSEYKAKRLWYLANQFILSPEKESAYFTLSAQLAFQVHALEVRLTRHKDLSAPRFKILEDYLNKHPLLKEYNRMRHYYGTKK